MSDEEFEAYCDEQYQAAEAAASALEKEKEADKAKSVPREEESKQIELDNVLVNAKKEPIEREAEDQEEAIHNPAQHEAPQE